MTVILLFVRSLKFVILLYSALRMNRPSNIARERRAKTVTALYELPLELSSKFGEKKSILYIIYTLNTVIAGEDWHTRTYGTAPAPRARFPHWVRFIFFLFG